MRRSGWLTTSMVGTVLLCAACTAGYPYPDYKTVEPRLLVREWRNGDKGTVLDLRPDGEFTAKRLSSDYFECSADGLQTKSGKGTWRTLDLDSGATSVELAFSDGCSSSLWYGEDSGKPVLFNDAEGENIVMKLK